MTLCRHPDVDAVLSTLRPDTGTWSSLCCLMAGLDAKDIRDVKAALKQWPQELPRKAPKEWLSSDRWKPFLCLCRDVTEISTYPLYIDAVAQSPLLRLSDGTPSTTLWRQQRGTVELQSGAKLALNDASPGMADLGGTSVLEWCSRDCGCTKSAESTWCRHCNRVEIYVEAEVKLLDDNIPPGAVEYRGTSKRKPTDTERDQMQRQQARLRRGGFYIFVDRVDDLVSSLQRYRDDVMTRLR